MEKKIRRNQLITIYGPGALVNFGIDSYIGLEIATWRQDWVMKSKIFERRLEKKLSVNFFVQPNPESDFHAPYRRFPLWVRCKKCNALYKSNQNDTSCLRSRCLRKNIVPVQFVTICSNGHLDEFPWNEWTHKRRNLCSKPSLSIKYSGSGAAGVKLKCICGATNTLSGALDKDEFEKVTKSCTGKRPWSEDVPDIPEKCDVVMRTAQRGASNIYFSSTVSALSIPPYNDEDILMFRIKNTNLWASRSSGEKGELSKGQWEKFYIANIAEELGETEEVIKNKINEYELVTENITDNTTDAYLKYQEYKAFIGGVNQLKATNDFKIENTNHDQEPIGIEQVTLVHSVREVRVLKGFSRTGPVQNQDSNENENEAEIKEVPLRIRGKSRWLPAIENRGEGIFISFSDAKLSKWEKSKNVQERSTILTNNLNNAPRGMGGITRLVPPISPRFIMLHTFAHLLINQLSYECGYASASLRERIYCTKDTTEGINMNGILIYTTSSDADGTLGGLVRQGLKDRLGDIISKAINSASWCSNDPLCIESKGQGYGSSNLAACYACALVSETSCEEFNKLLDRGMIVGTIDDSSIGFFNN